VAVVQYTFTHKQYTEQHNSLIWEECGTCPVFASYTLAFALQLREKTRENLSQGNQRMPVGRNYYYFSYEINQGEMGWPYSVNDVQNIDQKYYNIR